VESGKIYEGKRSEKEIRDQQGYCIQFSWKPFSRFFINYLKVLHRKFH